VVPEVRKQSGDNRWLSHVLARVSRIAVLSRLGVAGFFGGALVSSTAGAENAVRDVLRAMVTLHGATSYRNALQELRSP
jgi:molybdopterin biosynthesis enzyme MoaB